MAFLFEFDNLGFRTIQESDVDLLIKLDADPEVKAFFPGGALSEDQIPKKLKSSKINILSTVLRKLRRPSTY